MIHLAVFCRAAMDSIQSLITPAIARIVRAAPLSGEKVLFAWRMSVGPGIARVTRVRLGLAKVLDVEVTDARWRGELERSQSTVLERLRELLGPEEVQRIQFSGPVMPKKRVRHGPVKPLRTNGRRR